LVGFGIVFTFFYYFLSSLFKADQMMATTPLLSYCTRNGIHIKIAESFSIRRLIVKRISWFKPWGWIYRPTSWQGFLTYLITLAFCVQVFIAVDRSSHSVSDTLYGIFPYIVSCLVILNWVASKTSGVPETRET